MKPSLKSPTELYHYMAYKLNGITYLPHYIKECYVAPGYAEYSGIKDRNGDKFYMPDSKKEYSANELEKAGATKTALLLWYRTSFKPLQ